ncbi:hypothetical protein [Actinacidiphila oryziradicis]|uniref:Uncharacterized protein n=1 Tax=Actinacidiphila oryziradicis TaxID=2571141 RepID=A0A4U0SV52_9ACTN|nr:hypothetical protein [Actinacidiphila oryziradicis]TKA11957.1 hypothetical protein FCI23_09095 [Actinacidiphila oryziradicis]
MATVVNTSSDAVMRSGARAVQVCRRRGQGLRRRVFRAATRRRSSNLQAETVKLAGLTAKQFTSAIATEPTGAQIGTLDAVAHGRLHGAACHACLFAAETSCERGNHFLDRELLVETFSGRPGGFFTT